MKLLTILSLACAFNSCIKNPTPPVSIGPIQAQAELLESASWKLDSSKPFLPLGDYTFKESGGEDANGITQTIEYQYFIITSNSTSFDSLEFLDGYGKILSLDTLTFDSPYPYADCEVQAYIIKIDTQHLILHCFVTLDAEHNTIKHEYWLWFHR